MAVLALDDTDTRNGGCTTHTAFRLAEAITQAGGALRDWGLAAPARLVRLNPAAPHKTRGNGALVLPLGRSTPETPRVRIGTWSDGAPATIPAAIPAVSATPPSPAATTALARLIDEHLPAPGHGDQDPQPAAILLPAPPHPELYRAAVAQLVTPLEAWRHAAPGTITFTPSGRRGEIGALAAAAWQPTLERRWTWECIAYRAPSEIGTPRRIEAATRRSLQNVHGGFDNVDAATGRVRAVPRTPCPVAFAARGVDPHALIDAFGAAEPGGGGAWLLQTNQATGDHARHAPRTPGSHSMLRATVTVAAAPQRGRGGHLFMPAELGGGERVVLAAFEPTKGLRDFLGHAQPGDRFRVLGRTRLDPGVVGLEAVRVEALAPRIVRGPNPRCTACERAMKSKGQGAGYRCPGCGARAPAAAITPPGAAARLRVGARHQVPDHVRGHLLPPASGVQAALGLSGEAGAVIPPALLRGRQRAASSRDPPVAETTQLC